MKSIWISRKEYRYNKLAIGKLFVAYFVASMDSSNQVESGTSHGISFSLESANLSDLLRTTLFITAWEIHRSRSGS